jgi:hypothetical protein
LPEDFAPEPVNREAVARRIGSVMEIVSEDVYLMTVAAPVQVVKVYS